MELSRIEIGGESYPLKCDNLVLMEIQEKYGTVREFEKELVGLEEKRDENGDIILSEDGTPIFIKKEPSIKAINFALPLMINEGLEIEAEKNNTTYNPVKEKTLIRKINTNYYELSRLIHEEFSRCFVTKK